MSHRFSDRMEEWITFNEPWCVSFLGYGNGYFAPGISDQKMAAQVAHHLLLSHGAAARSIRAAAKKRVKVGIVLNLAITEALNPGDP
ncbi:family 1 glycosylhydrolase, partial [Acinetobacter baumannii]